MRALCGARAWILVASITLAASAWSVAACDSDGGAEEPAGETADGGDDGGGDGGDTGGDETGGGSTDGGDTTADAVDDPCPPGHCNDGNPCTGDLCDPLGGVCSHSTLEDGTSCGCNESGTCIHGLCAGAEQACSSHDDCDDSNDCTVDMCLGCACGNDVIIECVQPRDTSAPATGDGR